MKATAYVWVTRDPGVVAHWQGALGVGGMVASDAFDELLALPVQTTTLIWVDLASLAERPWTSNAWNALIKDPHVRVIALSSAPSDDEALSALDAGCVGYGHAFSNSNTLKQLRDVVKSGQVWVGQSLMQRILRTVGRAATVKGEPTPEWQASLTPREIEVAILAANAISNADIATRCNISERTVKAHLSSIFTKLHLTDRLQLALRVHGIT